MADPFIGEIRIFAGSFAPRDYAFCNGQTISVSQNPALFAIFGAIYGGDGRNDFGVPNLSGHVPVHAGTGSGLSPRPIGQRGGSDTVTLTSSNLPSHTHQLQASADAGTSNGPGTSGSSVLAEGPAPLYTTGAANVALNAASITNTGSGDPTDILQPYQVINFVVALAGIQPTP